MTLQLSQVQLAAVISYDFSLNWRSNYRKRNSVHGFDRLCLVSCSDSGLASADYVND